MAIQDILKKILDDADVEVSNIISVFQAEKSKLAEESAGIEKTELEAIDSKLESAFSSIETKMRTMARRENAKSLLTSKQKMITSAMQKFHDSLVNADDKMYSDILEKLFSSLPVTTGKVFAPSNRAELTKKFAKDLEVVSSDDVEGGFIVQSGGAEIDLSFQNIVFSEYADELRSYFADQLKLL
ncbi:MAG: hypothetical protein OEL89_04015 [Candidatus Peregrinibacteria bacterium]|nr:hypothetical protein [Candidatus Peregrinibacteria bacterium]